MRPAALAALFAVIYYGTGLLGRFLAAGGHPGTALWPPTGITAWTLAVLGSSAAPGLLVGAFAGSWLLTGSPLAAGGLAAGNVAAGLAAAHCLRRLPKGLSLYTPGGLLSLALLAGVSSLLSAAGSLAYEPGWTLWWGANVISVVVFTPLLGYWRDHHELPWRGVRAVEAAGLLLVSAAVFWAVFSNARNPAGYLALPPMIWAAVRFGLRETSALLAGLTLLDAWSTSRGLGPYPGSPLLAEAFVVVAGLLPLILAAAIWQTKDAAEALRVGEERLRLAADAAGVGTWDWDRGARKIVVDAKVRELFDLSEPVTDIDMLRRRVHPDDLGVLDRALAAADEQGRYECEHRVVLSDGRLRWLASRGRILDRGRVIGAIIDITGRRQARDELERRVRERTEELARANEELEAFTRSLSHDMRASLRKAALFRQLVLRDPQTKLGPEGLRLSERIAAAVAKMEAVMDGLLRLSTINRAPLERRPLDMSAMAAEVGREVAGLYPACPAEYVVQPGLTASGDLMLVREALRHLLENAWKFSGGRPGARIEFGRREGKFYVKDNGPGFEMPFSERIFGAFERLHSVEGLPGVGVGLALVRRAVERHGGRVWAEAKPGEGATFYFTLQPEAS